MVFHYKPDQENKNDDNHQNICRSPRYTLILLLLLIALEMGVLRGPMLLFLFFVMGLYRWVGKVFCKDNDYFIPANSIGDFKIRLNGS